jgi:hypothetical protein
MIDTHWKTKDGRIIAIKDMVTPHLINVYCMCRLQNDDHNFPEEVAITAEIEKRGLKNEVDEYFKVYRVMRS